MTYYELVMQEIKLNPKVWLVTGAAGFIGSNLTEALLRLNQKVVGLDNFSTGRQSNLDDIKRFVSDSQWANFTFIKGDIGNLDDCLKACHGVDIVLHQAALGSVPRSIENPIATNESNIVGFLNMLVAARDSKVKRFVYAASSSVYGDHPQLPKQEDITGKPLSPYAVTKVVNELYAQVFASLYSMQTIGLRYFNVFGKRQNPSGAYAAVIPKWIDALLNKQSVLIHGDGSNSRDFCYIENAIQANILAALTTNETALNQSYNVAVGDRITLQELYEFLAQEIVKYKTGLQVKPPTYGPPRAGDIPHSIADIGKARTNLNYEPKFKVRSGLVEAIASYLN